VRVDLWGTRGSIPSPGPETIRYGGNTSCVGVTLADGSLVVLDAGTGIRGLGLALPTEPTRIHLLLTHLHLDHIQGLAFFAPLFRPDAEVVIWGPASPEASLRDRIARYISAPLSPVEVRELPCDVSFRASPQEWEIGGARITATAVAHRGPTLGYRIDDAGSSLAYIPDHEPALGADLEQLEPEWISGFALAQGTDLLIHDGQYADEEYDAHLGWGHSALSHSLAFAARAEVGEFLQAIDDHDDLYTAFSRIVGAGEGFPQAAPLTREDFDEYFIRHSTAVSVACFGGYLVGASYIKPNFVGRAAHIANAGYFVSAPYRGTGVGRALVEHSLREARRLGFDAMMFNLVFESNQARALYRELGFEELGRVPKAVDGEDAVIYWRSLEDIEPGEVDR